MRINSPSSTQAEEKEPDRLSCADQRGRLRMHADAVADGRAALEHEEGMADAGWQILLTVGS